MKRFLVAACAAVFALSPIVADSVKGDGWCAACEDDAGKIKLATETIGWERAVINASLDGLVDLAIEKGDTLSAARFRETKSAMLRRIDIALMSMQLGRIDMEAK